MDTKLNQDRLHIASMNLIDMRENQVFTDVIINCIDGKIHAHRCVLMSSNTFFYKLFVDNVQQGRDLASVDFDLPVKPMSIIVNTLYGDAPHKFSDPEDLMYVLEAAYNVRDKIIITYCMTLFLSLLTLDNCVQMWNLSALHKQARAENCVKAYIIEHLPELLKTDKLSTMSVTELTHFVNCASELMCVGDDLLLLVVEWTKRNPHQCPDNVTTILNNLDKLVFSVDCIMDLLNTDNFVKTSPELTAYLMSAKAISHTLPLMPCEPKTPITDKCATSTTYSSSSPKASLSSCQTQPPLSISNSTENTCCLSSSDLVPSHDVEVGMYLHLYTQMNKRDTEIIWYGYSVKSKTWTKQKRVILSCNVASNWYPATNVHGEQFYFAISPNKTLLAYYETTKKTFVGPNVSFQSRVAAICDGWLMYIWSYETIAQFDTRNFTWKTLSPNRNVAAGWSNLLVTNGELFFHAAFPPVIYKYNFERNDWDLEKSFGDTYNVKSIRCKCLCSNDCKSKLYFIVNDKQLFYYNTKTNEWTCKGLPDFQSRVPILMNCEQMFIVFIDKHFESKIFFFYPELDRMEMIECEDEATKNANIVYCDLSLKGS